TASTTYNTPGKVTVGLRTFDNSGNHTTETRSLTISDPPTASFTASPNPALTGQTVAFDASASSDPNGPIADYKWDLDGNGSFETDTATNSTASTAYSSSGGLTVPLRTIDNSGNSTTTTRSITINDPPVASFTASPNPALTGQTVTYDASASNDPNGTITNYKWDLDGNGTFETDTGTKPTAT